MKRVFAGRVPRIVRFTVLILMTALGTAYSAGPAGHERDVFRAVNDYRSKQGLSQLKWNSEAAAEARLHARNIAARKASGPHAGFQERVARLRKSLGINSAAENVACLPDWQGVGQRTLELWLDSAGHRKNLMMPFELTGVGAASYGRDTVCVTQIYLGSAPLKR